MKNITEKIDIAFLKMIGLAFIINRKTKCGVFIRDSAHCESITLEIIEDKKKYEDKQIEVEIRYSNDPASDWDKDSESRLESINKVIAVLEGILKNNRFNYDLLEPVYEKALSHYVIPHT